MTITLSNFELTHRSRNPLADIYEKATVEVTERTGALWWAKTSNRKAEIARRLSGFWFFTETGEFTPREPGRSLGQSVGRQKRCVRL